tara:strand:- start:29 stop:379 length:351 start_codon:yes stop_codon:yes gene_type:complete
MDDAQSIYSRLKGADNSQLWAIAQEVASTYKKYEKLKEKNKEKKTSNKSIVDLTDKEGLRTSVLEHLFTESSKGNAQASDKLANLAGLKEATQDIIIEIVNYNPPKKVRKKLKSKT